MELKDIADELYALLPSEFTAARNERAKVIRAEDKALATAVKALPKPSTAAWVVNMLVRHQAEQVDQVLSLGSALRQAQDDLDADQMRELNKQRRQVTAAVTSQARALAADLGVTVTEAVADQIEETLRAAMTDEGAARAVRTGQLVEPLTATGVGELDVSGAVAVPEAIGGSARPVQRKRPELSVVGASASSSAAAGSAEEDGSAAADAGAAVAARAAADAGAAVAARAAAVAAAEKAVAEAQAEAAKSSKKLDKAEKRVAKLEARSLQLQGELEEVRRRAGELEHELESTDDELAAAEEKRDGARERAAAAEAALDDARAVLR